MAARFSVIVDVFFLLLLLFFLIQTMARAKSMILEMLNTLMEWMVGIVPTTERGKIRRVTMNGMVYIHLVQNICNMIEFLLKRNINGTMNDFGLSE